MAHGRTYRTTVKIGNWNEDLCLEEDAKKEYLEKKERGELAAQKADFLKHNILRPVNLSVTNDGRLHFGDVVMLVNLGGENRERSAGEHQHRRELFDKDSFTWYSGPMWSQRRTSVDGSPEGSTLLFEQSFALKTTSGFARGLYLTSDLKSFQKCAKKSRLQEVNLEDDGSFLSWWKIVHFDPQERLEYEGQPVPANVEVLIIHCKTNQALAVLGDQILWTTYGKEYEVTAHTFLDSHKAEQDNNHWILCTSDPAGDGLVLLKHPENSKELTQANPDSV